jgi:hypothetical protein
MVTFLHSECDIGSFLLCEQDAASCNFPRNLRCSDMTAALVTRYLTSKASNKPKVSGPDKDATLIIHQGAVKNAFCVLRAKIA